MVEMPGSARSRFPNLRSWRSPLILMLCWYRPALYVQLWLVPRSFRSTIGRSMHSLEQLFSQWCLYRTLVGEKRGDSRKTQVGTTEYTGKRERSSLIRCSWWLQHAYHCSNFGYNKASGGIAYLRWFFPYVSSPPLTLPSPPFSHPLPP